LEQRLMFDGGHVFGRFWGNVANEEPQLLVPISLTASDFSLVGSKTILGFQVQRDGEGSLDPAPVQILNAAGAPVSTVRMTKTDLANNAQSLTLIELPYGDYTAVVGADRATTGGFRLDVVLAGDVNGDRKVDTADLTLLRSYVGSTAGSPNYHVEADANLDGIITSFDYTQARDNNGDRTIVQPMSRITLEAIPTPVSLSGGGLVTNVSAIGLQGTVGPGVIIALETGGDGGFDNGTVTSNSSGSFRFSSVPIQVGANTLQVRASDSFGQWQTETLELVLDVAAPVTTITSPLPAVVTDENPLVEGRVLDDYAGVDHLDVALDDGVFSRVLVDLLGHFSFTTILPLDGSADGYHTLRFRATDLAGNVSDVFERDFTLLTVSPTTPVVDLLSSSDSGVSDHDNLTNIATPTIVVSADPDASVSLFLNGQAIGHGIATHGQVQFTLDSLLDGPHELTAQARTVSGRISELSQPFVIHIDTHIAEPRVELAYDSDSGSLGDFKTTIAVVVLEGKSDAGATVALQLTGHSAIADSNGQFQLTDVNLLEGENLFSATATDGAGNQSTSHFSVTHVSSAGNEVILQWNQVLNAAMVADTVRVGPTWASRSMGIVNASMYDAVMGILRTRETYLVDLPAPPGASAAAAAAAAAHQSLSALYPAQQPTFDAALATSLAAIPPGAARTDGVVYGAEVGRRIVTARAGDGSEDLITYVPGTQPGDWRPTFPNFAAAVTPHWGGVQPFTIASADQFRAPSPPPLNSEEYAAAFQEVYELGRVDSTTRTADQTEMAIFWAYDRFGMGSPVMLYEHLAQTVAESRGNTLEENAHLFGLLGLAMADAGIAGWETKYHFPLWRPITAIREADTDGNSATVADTAWLPLGAPAQTPFTPAFPSYVSGHATFGGALFEALKDFYGTDNVPFELTSAELPDVTRSFTSFSQAAYENGRSRIYLGVHWNFDDSFGQVMGNQIADYIQANYLQPLAGPSVSATLSHDTGISDLDSLTSNPAVRGRIHSNAPLEAVRMAVDGFNLGDSVDITGQVDSNGLFTFDRAALESALGVSLVDGSHTLYFQVQDQLGASSSLFTLPFTLDTLAPESLSFQLDPAYDSPPQGDSRTTEMTVRLIGQSEPGASALLVQPGLTATADQAGSYAFAGVALAPGINPFTVWLTDAAGNQRETSISLSKLELTGVAPQVTAALRSDTGVSSTDGMTFDPTIVGMVTDDGPIASVAASLDAPAGGPYFDISALVQTSGAFTLQLADLQRILGASLADGVHTLRLVATDQSANASEEFVLTFTLDRQAPSQATFSLAADSRLDPANAALTTLAEVSIMGQAEPGQLVVLSPTGATTTAGLEGFFSFSSLAVTSGLNPFTTTATDAAGNQAVFSISITRVDQAVDPVGGDTIELAESSGWLSQQAFLIDLGQAAGSRRLSFEVNAAFDTSDSDALVGDLLQVYLADSANPGHTLLDRGREGEAIFSLGETGADFLPGQVTFNGTTVTVDLSSLADHAQGLLIVQLINGDGDDGTTVTLGQFANTVDDEGVAATVFRSDAIQASPGAAVDISGYSLVPDGSIEVNVQNVRVDGESKNYRADLSLRNQAGAVSRGLIVRFNNLPAGVEVPNASGFDASGNPYMNLAPAINSGGLDSGAVTSPVELVITNPDGVRFELEVEVLSAGPNRAPVFAPLAPISVMPGAYLEVPLVASDPDGDSVRFSILPGGSMPTISLSASGRLVITPEANQIGSYSLTLIASDGFARTNQTIQIDVVADPITTTRLSGVVQSTLFESLSGIQISVGDVISTTDAEGRFQLEFSGDLPSDLMKIAGYYIDASHIYPSLTEELGLLLDHPIFPGINNQIARPIYLPLLDLSAGTQIMPDAETTITSLALPGMSIQVAPNSMTTPEGDPFTGMIAVSIVPPDQTPANLPAGLFPGTVITIQPGGMFFTTPAPITFPNNDGYLPGEILDFWSANPYTGVFENVAKLQVSADGQVLNTIEGGVRTSSWGFLAQPPESEDEPDDADEECESCKAKAAGNSEIELQTGIMLETHDLTTYQSQGQTRSLTLAYNSSWADPQKIVRFGYSNTVTNPSRRLVASMTLNRGAFSQQVPGFELRQPQSTDFQDTHFQIEEDDTFIDPEFGFQGRNVGFSGTQGQFVNFDVQWAIRYLGSEGVVAIARIFAPDGSLVHSATLLEPGAFDTAPFVLPQTGDYRMSLEAYGGIVDFYLRDVSNFGLQGGEHFWQIPGGNIHPGLLVDMSELPSGVYNYSLTTGRRQFTGSQFTGSSSTREGELVHVNRVDSPFGSGWGIAGLQEIVENPDGSVLLIDGDGTEVVFDAPPAAGLPFGSPVGDFSRLEKLPGGGFRRTAPDQMVWMFDSSNRIASVSDRNGNVTQYLYNLEGQLRAIVDPVGLQTTFDYSDGRVTSITDPTGRITALAYDAAGNLVEVTDPDNARRTWEYDGRHHLRAETDQLGRREQTFYDFAGRVTRAVLKDGTEIQVSPPQVRGILRPDATIDPLHAPVAPLRSPPVSSYADANGNVVNTLLDRAGQVVSSSDSVGNLPAVQRNSDNLVTQLTNGRGQVTSFTYDARGNLLTVSDPLAFGGGGVSNTLSDPFFTAVSDLNGDQLPDLVTLVDTTAGTAIAIQLRNSDGTFQPPTLLGLSLGARHVSLGDLDGDGDQDLVTTNLVNTDSSTGVFLAAGDGTFAPVVEYAVGAGVAAGVLGDVDGDGDLDVIAANRLGGSVSVLTNQGDGTFAGRIHRTGRNPVEQAIGDFNADGRPDVVTANSAANSLSVLLGGDSSAFESLLTISLGQHQALSVTTGDVDGDGDLDLVATTYATYDAIAQVRILIGNGDGTFSARPPVALGSARPATVRLGDLDGDDDLDVLVATTTGLRLLRNFGDGSFGVAESSNSVAAGQLALGDVDGDGDLDVASVPSSGSQVRVWINDGAGGFIAGNVQSVVSGAAAGMSLADLDNDGNLDLVVGRRASNSRIQIFRGSGSGTFSLLASHSVSPSDIMAVAVGDLDADGDQDLIISEQQRDYYSYYSYRDSAQLRVLLGDGTGGYSANVPIPLAVPLSSIALSEAPGDSNVDLIGTSASGSRVVVLAGDGGGMWQVLGGQFAEFAAGEGAVALAIGDVDGDGDLDLVTTSTLYNQGSALALLLGMGNGTFAEPTLLPVSGNQQAVVMADLDGDGDLDLAAALSDLRRVAVLQGDGNGNFTERLEYATRGEPIALAAFDADRDGDLDLVVVSEQDSSVEVLTNAGNGSFPGLVLHTGRSPRTLAAGDMNGDGLTDVVTADRESISLLLGAPGGGFLPARHFPTTINAPTDAALGDVDQDGDLDLVVTGQPYSSTGGEVLFNVDGSLSAPVPFELPWYPSAVALGDLNGDGWLDLAATNSFDGIVGVSFGGSGGNFGAVVEYQAGLGTADVILSDVNGDGALDLVTANRIGDSVSVILNRGDGTFPQPIITLPDAPTSQAFGDFDGDGILDLVTANRDYGSLSLLIGQDDGAFHSPSQLNLGGSYSPLDVAVGDLNGDGNLDLITIAAPSFGNVIAVAFLGVGDGTFTEASSLPVSTFGYDPETRLHVGDFDEDGDLDVLASATYRVQLLRNDGAANFLSSELLLEATGPVAVGDVDGDGDLDIVTSNIPGEIQSKVFLNNGAGEFPQSLPLTFPANSIQSAIELADLNGDGDLDLVVQQSVGLEHTLSVLLGAGDGSFSAAAVIAQTGSSNSDTYSLAVGDVDGDGDVDIAVVVRDNAYYYYYSRSNLTVLLGDGLGGFTALSPLSGSANSDQTALADFDNDGILDLVGLNTSRHALVILPGDGTGSFGGEVAVGNGPQAIVAGDVDGDGDIDLLVANRPNSYYDYGSDQSVTLLLGQGDVAFASQQRQLPVTSEQRDAILEDLDGDGDLDVAVALADVRRVAVLLRNSDGTFAERREYATRGAATKIIALDANGDGDVDLVVSSSQDSSVEVLFNSGLGTFPNHVLHTGQYPQSLAAGDLDGDGLDDLVTVNYTNVSVLRGIADGSYGPAIDLAVGLDYPRGAAFGDIDGDGDLDVIVVGGSYTSGGLATLLRNDGGALIATTPFAAGIDAESVSLGDLDGDGVLDLVTTSYNASVAVLAGVGDGSFRDLTEYAAIRGASASLLRDIDGDVDLDILTLNRYEDTFSVIPNLGGGIFEGRLNRTGRLPVEQALGDLNGDGRIDVVTADQGSRSVSILLADVDGTYRRPLSLSLGVDNVVSLAVGDLDGDGDLDLAVATYDNNYAQGNSKLHFFEGHGDGSFTPLLPVAFPTDARLQQVRLGDTDGDGDLDAIVGTNSGLLLVENTGSGQWATPVELLSVPTGRLSVGDLDNDGDLDIVAATPYFTSNLRLTVLRNDNGNFSTAATFNRGTGRAVTLDMADLDADGDLDVVLGRQLVSSAASVEVLSNQGNGTFLPPSTWAVDGDDPAALAIGDLDGDGDLDIAVATQGGYYYYNTQPGLAVLFGNGLGGFTAAPPQPLRSTLDDLAFSDINNDGRLDLLGLSAAGSRVEVLLGDGAGVFLEPTPAGNEFAIDSSAAAWAIGDVDGDGDMDLVIANGYGSQAPALSLLLGHGDGTFSPPQALPVSGWQLAVVLTDLDGDGDLDIAAALPSVRRVAVLLGQGDGTFSDRREYATRDDVTDLAAVDSDGDGDVDLIVISEEASSAQVLLNAGAASFGDQILYTGARPKSLVIADMNGDGLADLVTSNSRGDSISILVGTAAGSFLPATDTVSASSGQGSQGTGRQEFTYDPIFSQVTSFTDELGRQTLFQIDPTNGNVLSSTQVVGLLDSVSGEQDDIVTRFTYTTQGLVDTVTDPLGRVTDYEYDAFGRTITIVMAQGTSDEGTRRYEYDAAGNVTASIDENGNRTEFVYDAMNLLTQITEADPDGSGPLTSPISQFVFDLRGNLTQTIDPANNATTNEYDARDRLIRTIDADDQATTFAYDRAGNLLSIVDPLGNETRNRYDVRNRLTETIDAEGGRTRFAYDSDNNLILVVDPVGNSTSFVYDQRDRLIEEIDPRGQSLRYSYDPANQLVSKTDRNGRKTTFDYDDLGRLVSERWVGAGGTTENVIDYDYDPVSNLVAVVDRYSALAFTYDARDRVKTVDNSGTPGAPLVTLTYGYDAAGNILSAADTIGGAAGGTTQYQYDALNRQTQIMQSGSGVSDKRVDLAYNPLGQFASIDRFSNLAGTQLVVGSTYEYDALNRLTSLTHDNSTSTVAFYDFVYDAAGRIAQITDVDGVTTYGYDDTNQLTSTDHSAAGIPDEVYSYDANGNRTSSQLHGDGYRTGTGNRLLSDGTYNYTYDNEGNLIRRAEIATGVVREFQWDQRNRLIAVTDTSAAGIPTQRVTLSYDAFNRRILKGVDITPLDAIDSALTHFVYDHMDVILEFVDSDGTGPSETDFGNRYLHGPTIDQVIAQEDEMGFVTWHLSDQLGSVRDLVDDFGHLTSHVSYDSYGRIVDQVGDIFNSRYQFTSREFDQDLELYFYRARYYEASIGRFLSEDPIRFNGGDLNLLSYVGNDPLNFRDPFGLKPESLCKALRSAVDAIDRHGGDIEKALVDIIGQRLQNPNDDNLRSADHILFAMLTREAITSVGAVAATTFYSLLKTTAVGREIAGRLGDGTPASKPSLVELQAGILGSTQSIAQLRQAADSKKCQDEDDEPCRLNPPGQWIS
jgi:RHS repeat-associated protein